MHRSPLIVLVLGALILTACGVQPKPPVETALPPLETAYPPPEGVSPTSEAYPAPGMPLEVPNPYPAPGETTGYEPLPGDETLERGLVDVNLAGSRVIVLQGEPSQAVLVLVGTLPDPCHKLRVVVSSPDDQGRIQVDTYSLIVPGEVCTAVIQPFEARLSLGSLAAGSYSVWVNGQKLGDFTL